MVRKDYTLSISSWKVSSEDVVKIVSSAGAAIGYFPVPFLRNGGDDTWQFVLDVSLQLIQTQPGDVWEIRDSQNRLVSKELAPEAGTYVLLSNDRANDVQFAHGPEYFKARQAPEPGGSMSTRSDSKRSSVNQSQFRTSLVARDGVCIVTGQVHVGCTACHIVPVSREDVYRELLRLDKDMNPPQFDPSYGLLLRDDLHHAFDRLEFSFYFKNGTFFLHLFILTSVVESRLHGKAISADYFRGPPEYRPDPRFMQWHYRQCVLTHIRGFSSGMALDAE